jgi:GGDEF domain-containing protein
VWLAACVTAPVWSQEDQPFRLSVSAGLAEVRHHRAASPEDVRELADAALYEAKNRGRNQSAAAATDHR